MTLISPHRREFSLYYYVIGSYIFRVYRVKCKMRDVPARRCVRSGIYFLKKKKKMNTVDNKNRRNPVKQKICFDRQFFRLNIFRINVISRGRLWFYTFASNFCICFVTIKYRFVKNCWKIILLLYISPNTTEYGIFKINMSTNNKLINQKYNQ